VVALLKVALVNFTLNEYMMMMTYLWFHGVRCNLKTDDQILIIFDTNILDTTGHQMTIYVPIAPNACFCTTWGKQNKQNINF